MLIKMIFNNNLNKGEKIYDQNSSRFIITLLKK